MHLFLLLVLFVVMLAPFVGDGGGACELVVTHHPEGTTDNQPR